MLERSGDLPSVETKPAEDPDSNCVAVALRCRILMGLQGSTAEPCVRRLAFMQYSAEKANGAALLRQGILESSENMTEALVLKMS